MTGSSWTTIATIGVALMGIGRAMGFPEGWVAGAIISGAYFGDKLSLLSDTTVLASSTVGVDVFAHIRYMLRTTVPSMLLALAVFTVAGLTLAHGNRHPRTTLRRDAARLVPHHAVAAAGAAGDRPAYRAQAPGNRHPLRRHGIRLHRHACRTARAGGRSGGGRKLGFLSGFKGC